MALQSNFTDNLTGLGISSAYIRIKSFYFVIDNVIKISITYDIYKDKDSLVKNPVISNMVHEEILTDISGVTVDQLFAIAYGKLKTKYGGKDI
jgi:hypothetical protein